MNYHRLKQFFITLSSFLMLVQSSLQISSSLKNSELKSPKLLPEIKFNYNEYAEYPDNEEIGKGPQSSQWLLNRDVSLTSQNLSPNWLSFLNNSDKSITWDDKWPLDIKFGQLSAVSIDPLGNVAVFHRGDRVWGLGTFDAHEKFNRDEGPIRENTVVVLSNVSGEKIFEWGKNMFYLPHGLTIDHLGNYWITDVAMHQVFKFDAKDVGIGGSQNGGNVDAKLKNSDGERVIKPTLILGEAFEPGNDEKRFCKPTAVAVQENGDFFVSDGYCNSRIIKFNYKGERILTWGRKWGFEKKAFHSPPSNAFFVPHALALAEDLGYIFVADRENGRVTCYHSNNGTFHKEYKYSVIGNRIFSIAYAKGKIYLVNGPEFLLATSTHVRGFVIDVETSIISSQFTSAGTDMKNPHDIAVSKDGRYIYVVELDPHKIHRFLQDVNSTQQPQQQQQRQQHNKEELISGKIQSSSGDNSNRKIFSSSDVKNSSIDKNRNGVTATTIILSLITAAVVLVALCVAIAAIVARCRKRGCLLTVRRGGGANSRWESERRENFKLSKLLETRKSKGRNFFDKRPNTRDFSKLNTEPETSDDENNLTKII